MLTGAVMAGGRSRRMGRDKAALILDGETLLRRQVRVLREAGAARVLVVHRAGQSLEAVEGCDYVADTVADAGPLAGLHAALAASHSGHLAVLAVDMPRIDARWFARLLADCAPGRGALARTDAGYEPLAAVYPAEAAKHAAAQLRTGDHSLQTLITGLVRDDRMREFPAGPEDAGRLVSWNEPADLPGALRGRADAAG